MRWSKALIPTSRKPRPTPSPRATSSCSARGWSASSAPGPTPTCRSGFRVLNKVVRIIREEMDAAGALELLMPALQPIELWKESGRYETFGDLLMQLKTSSDQHFALGPTHEEVVTDLVRDLVRSYKQLPITLYQIQTKFRDEPRPRFGILRTREFLMKDAYSFDANVEQLNASYDAMYEAYCRIFDRCGIPYVDRRGRERPDRRRQLARVHGPLLDRRGHDHPVPRLRLRGQQGAGRDRRRPDAPPRPTPSAPPFEPVATPEPPDDPGGLRLPQGRPSRDRPSSWSSSPTAGPSPP